MSEATWVERAALAVLLIASLALFWGRLRKVLDVIRRARPTPDFEVKPLGTRVRQFVWEVMLQCLSKEERAEFERWVKRTEFRPDKKALASELKAGREIPGADLHVGEYPLVVS